MIPGVFIFGISFLVMWFVPSENQNILFIFFLIIKLSSDFGYTLVNVPALALLNDLCQSYDDRFQINTLRTLVVALGSLVSIGCISIFLQIYQTPQEAFPRVAAIYITLVIASILNCSYQTRSLQNNFVISSKTQNSSIFSRFRQLLSVKTARLSIFVYVVAASAVQITLAMVPYLLQDYFHLSSTSLIFLVLTAQLSGIATAIVLLFMAKKFEKRKIFAVGVVIWGMFYLCVPWIPKENTNWLYGLCFILGIGMASALLIPMSFVTDSAEWVEYETGMKLEGALYGSLHLFNKMLVGVLIFIFEQILATSGFDGNLVIQPPSIFVFNKKKKKSKNNLLTNFQSFTKNRCSKCNSLLFYVGAFTPFVSRVILRLQITHNKSISTKNHSFELTKKS